MNSHNPLQDVQPPLLTKQDTTTQCGLQRSWEWSPHQKSRRRSTSSE
jgi:hypothetical protein